MMACQYAWQDLTSAQRKQWNQFVAFSGQSINRDRGILTTGHALFLKYNYARLAAGLSVLDTIVYKSAPTWPGLYFLQVAGGILYVNYTVNLVGLNILVSFFISPARPPSQSFSRTKQRYLPGGIIAGSLIHYDNTYYAIFGRNPQVGEFYHCRYQFFSTVSPILSSIQTGVYEMYPFT